MDKLVKYIDCYIPTETCNFKCHYCYIARQGKFNKKLVNFDYTPQYIRKALSKERLGGTCLLNLCAGGETLLSPEVLPLMKELLLEGHYLTVVTNGSMTSRFKEIDTWDASLKQHIMFKFSFHYLELKRLNLMNTFFDNVRLMRDSGCSITVEVTPNDEIIPYIDDIKQVCLEELGALCHITIARDDCTDEIRHLSDLSFEDFYNTWKTFDSDLLDFKYSIFYEKRKEFCYAGCWSLYLNIAMGDLQQCIYGNYLCNIFKNVDEPIFMSAVGNKCEYPHCYNGHSYLTLGAIPELKTPTLLKMRDRIYGGNSHWIKKEFADFIDQQFFENNEVFSKRQKEENNRKYFIIKVNSLLHNLKKRISK